MKNKEDEILRFCPLCHTSLEKYVEELDKVICPNDEECGVIVTNNYYGDIDRTEFQRQPS